MSDVLSKSTVDAVLSRKFIDPMTHSIKRQKSKHINWKFEDVGFKFLFYQRLDSILDASPGGLLRINRGTDTNRLTDFLTFLSNSILKSGKKIFGMRKP